MKKIRTEYGHGRRGFTRWVRPVMNKYMMACCDCGLVHEMQLYAVRVTKKMGRDYWAGELLPRRDYRVMFRARRAAGYTRRQRKSRGIT